MNRNKSSELLSAYYDGETSPEELASVEELLETSSEARRELDDIGALSELLHCLPRQRAAVELAPSIMNRAERESLLPAVADSAKASSRPLSRLRVATGLVTVAAVLLLVVFLINSPNPDQSDSVQIVQHRNFEQADQSAESSAASSVAEAAPADHSAAGGNLVDAAGLPQTLPATESKVDVRSFSNSALNQSRLRDVQIGDVIPYFAVAQNQVAVLEVTVIDVQKAVGVTQLLLERQQIPKIAQSTTMRITERTLQSNENLKSADHLQKTTVGVFAVYIESSESQLAETMEQLRQAGILADLKLLPPVELSQVKLAGSDSFANANMRNQQKQEQVAGTLADAVFQGRSQWVQRTASAAALGSARAQPLAADKLSSKNKSLPDNKDAVPKGEDTLRKKTELELKTTTGDKPGETGNAFQLLINVLPRSLTEKSSDKPGAKQQQAAEAVKKAKRAATSTKEQAKSVVEESLPDDTPSAPIRVILVFQGRPAAEATKPESYRNPKRKRGM